MEKNYPSKFKDCIYCMCRQCLDVICSEQKCNGCKKTDCYENQVKCTFAIVPKRGSKPTDFKYTDRAGE